MILIYNAILFVLTLIGGSVPLWYKNWSERSMKYLLAFSGAFLLSITFLHLIPESIEEIGPIAGMLLLFGFFIQQFFQKFTHGVEHGHAHIEHSEHKHVTVWPILIGLSVHAFGEGLPLGITYSDEGVLPSLFLAIALHKLPEAMLIMSLFYHEYKKKNTILVLVLFSLITPFASLLAYYLGHEFTFVATLIHWMIPVIAGAFIHISTTIFFESGTKIHEMTFKKWMVILTGIGIALLSLLVEH